MLTEFWSKHCSIFTFCLLSQHIVSSSILCSETLLLAFGILTRGLSATLSEDNKSNRYFIFVGFPCYTLRNKKYIYIYTHVYICTYIYKIFIRTITTTTHTLSAFQDMGCFCVILEGVKKTVIGVSLIFDGYRTNYSLRNKKRINAFW